MFIIIIILFLVIIVLIHYMNKINKASLKEQFSNPDGNYIDKMDYSNEILVKFCRKLRQLDKPNDFNILLKNMKDKSIEQNNSFSVIPSLRQVSICNCISSFIRAFTVLAETFISYIELQRGLHLS